ncbi:MAG: type II secretion system major pseudopilin GspG [Phycisphaerales bacterium]|nr:type II secretion system major pseudopilin GspG [Phycisphaerales bacterium]
MHARHNRTGFTLIELLIVIGILLALGAIVTVNFISIGDIAEQDVQRAQFDQVDSAMKRFRLDLKRYPSEDEGIEVLWNRDALENEDEGTRWKGPYLEEPVVSDRWGRSLTYTYPGELVGESYYDLVSMGPDGEEGTADDITNHDRRKTVDGEFEEDESFTGDRNSSVEG